MSDTDQTVSEIVLGGVTFAPEGEMLKFHVTSVANGTNKNYDTGIEEPCIVVDATLDSDVEGKGNSYRMWLTNSLHELSIMGKLVKAIYGETRPVKASEIIGMPFQATLKKNKAGTRQKFEAFFKPDKSQSRVEVVKDTVLDDLPASGLDLDEIFPD